MIQEELIFDIGFHKGEDTGHYLEQGFKVIAIDANPLLCQQGESSFAQAIASGRLVLLNIGMSDREAVLDFWVNRENSEWSSFVEEIGTRGRKGSDVIKVPCKPVSWLFEQYGVPYYMKVDIEGHDHYCIAGITASHRPKYVSCEANDVSLLHLMRDRGYTKFKCIDQSDKFEPLDNRNWESKSYRFMKRVTGILSGSRLQHRFPIASSGPFAENTHGPWKSWQEIEKEFLYFFETNPTRQALNNRSWFDFHATF